MRRNLAEPLLLYPVVTWQPFADPFFGESAVVQQSEVPILIDTYEHGARTALGPRFLLPFL